MLFLKMFKACSFNRLSRAGLIFSLFFYSSLFAGEPALQKPQAYSDQENITGWVMSEKLDGIRGYWDGIRMYTRKASLASTAMVHKKFSAVSP